MKKLISLLLVICMLCPLLVGCANQDEDYKMKKKYIRQFKIEDKEPEDVIIDYDGGTYNGARIVMLDTEWHDPEKWTETVDGVEIKYYDSNRLYAYKNGKFFTLTDAYDKNKLSREDIVAVGEEFNKKVNHFIDICDKYDFPEGKILEVDERDKQYINYRSIYIFFDYRINKGPIHSNTAKKYLNSDIITEIAYLAHGYMHKEFGEYYSVLMVASLTEPTKECADRAMEEIVKIPGVLGVSYFYPVGFPAEATTASYSSNEYSWINDIKVDKVWEFTI